jgi:EAL domain-containing protein (putative c-di-GMP-specific phosphodiesterase class I)/DNA-binding response OmpR family regulator
MTQQIPAARGERPASRVDSLAPSILVLLLDSDGRLIHANRAALELSGARLVDVAGTPADQLPFWCQTAPARETLARAIEDCRRGESSEVALSVKTQRGGSAAMDFTLRPVAGPNPESSFMILSGSDVAAPRRVSASPGVAAGSDAPASGPKALPAPEAPPRDAELLALRADLAQAIKRNQLHLVYQPQVAIDSGEIVGVEALLRWNHPERGEVSPARFVPLAEESGLINPLGDWVLRRACLVARKWQRQGLPAVRMMINVSACQLQDDGFAARVQQLLAETGLEPCRLGIEITETVLVHNLANAAAQLRRLRGLGVEIALDDFGTGYSSLSYLRRLPLDVVKIDRSLVPGVTGSSDALPIIRAIIAMTHSLGMKVLAEGVTNEGELELLAANRCDMFQGYHFSMPVSAEQAETMLRNGRRLPVLERRRAARARHILLVDDDADVVSRMSQRLVWRFGDAIKVTTCTDPRDALQLARQNPFDIFAIDLRMPGIDGLTLTSMLRQIQPDAVRVMLLGPADLARVVEDERQVDVFRYVSKPCRPEQLYGHFQAALKQVDRARADGTLLGGLASGDSAAGAASLAATSLQQIGRDIMTVDRGPLDEMVLPTQLPTMPGDLWALRDVRVLAS